MNKVSSAAGASLAAERCAVTPPSPTPSLAAALPLETSRLFIRGFVPEDAPAVYAYMADAEVTRWLPEGVFDVAAAQAFVAAQILGQARAFAIVAKLDDQLIGHLVFHPWGDEKNRTFEIGWVVSRSAQGHGYATEVAGALLALAFNRLELHRVIATCQPENPASRRVAEKIGMRCEGLFRQCIYRGEGVWWDELFYGVLAEEHALALGRARHGSLGGHSGC